MPIYFAWAHFDINSVFVPAHSFPSPSQLFWTLGKQSSFSQSMRKSPPWACSSGPCYEPLSYPPHSAFGMVTLARDLRIQLLSVMECWASVFQFLKSYWPLFFGCFPLAKLNWGQKRSRSPHILIRSLPWLATSANSFKLDLVSQIQEDSGALLRCTCSQAFNTCSYCSNSLIRFQGTLLGLCILV